MENTPVSIAAYLASYDRLRKQLNDGGDSRRTAIRDQAISFFKEKGFPTNKEEAWRYTNIEPISNRIFEIGQSLKFDDKLKEKAKANLFLDWPGLQFVFIDGKYQAEISLVNDAAPESAVAINFKSLSAKRQEKLTASIENSPGKTNNAFTALNTAFFDDGLWIDVPGNLKEKIKIHIIHFSTTKKLAVFPRCFIKVGANSSIELAETYAGNDDREYFNNITTDIELAKDARLNHYKIQLESSKAYHIAHTYVRQSKNSDYQAFIFSSGGAIARNAIQVVHEGEQCETTLNGLYLGHKNQLVDNQTLIDHASPHCRSRELYRGILTGKSRGVFSGKIMVRPDAQKTDAEQNNNCLLLSEEARIDSKPQLEIYADDVKCTHGATVGQLDEEALFYMQSRGIGEQKARNILISSFAEEILEGINDNYVKDKIKRLILKRLEDDMQFHKNGAA